MNALIKQNWLILDDGRIVTREQRDSEFFGNRQKPIKVVGHKWQLNDLSNTTVTKQFQNPKHGVGGDVLVDRSGIIMDEPPEIVGPKFVVVYNADGSERFRLKPNINPDMFPSYLHSARLVGYQFFYDKPHAHFEAAYSDRVLEFDLDTGAYTGKQWEVR